MEIKYKSCELDKKQLYKHTRGMSIPMKEVQDGKVITPAEIVVYTDSRADGSEVIITSIIDTNGAHYTTSSDVFRRELSDIVQIMDGEPFDLVVIKKQSKTGGRTYVTCSLA